MKQFFGLMMFIGAMSFLTIGTTGCKDPAKKSPTVAPTGATTTAPTGATTMPKTTTTTEKTTTTTEKTKTAP